MDCRQVRTVDESIKHDEALTYFRNEKNDKFYGKEMRSSHDKGGEDRSKIKEKQSNLKNHDTYKYDGKKFGCQSYDKRKVQTIKGHNCHKCGGLNFYARCR